MADGEARVTAMEARNEMLAARNTQLWRRLVDMVDDLSAAQLNLQRVLATRTQQLLEATQGEDGDR